MQDPVKRLEMLKGRLCGLGGSDMPAIAGVDPYNNAMDVFLDKVREPTVSDAANIHILRGMILEDVAATLYSEQTGRVVRRMGQRSHPDYPHFIVNVDRQVLSDGDRSTGAMEIKAPSWKNFQRILDEGASASQIIQESWGIFVCQYEWGPFCAINLEHQAGPLIHFDLERNNPLIDNLAQIGDDFWHKHVVPRRAPTPLNWPLFRTPLEIPKGLVKDLCHWTDPVQIRVMEELAEAHRAKKHAEEQYDEKRTAALELMDRSTRVEVEGIGRISAPWIKGRTTFDKRALALYGALDPHTKDELDLSLFERQGDAYQQFTFYPSKERQE